jgi:hypothetical protein
MQQLAPPVFSVEDILSVHPRPDILPFHRPNHTVIPAAGENETESNQASVMKNQE